MGKKKKDTMELRFYEVPQNEYVLALTGDKWIRDYGHDETGLHFHNLMEIGYCKSGTGELILDDLVLPYRPVMISIIPQNYPHITISTEGEGPSYWEYIFFDPLKVLAEIYPDDVLYQREVFHLLSKDAHFLNEWENGNLAILVKMILDEMRIKRPGYAESVHGMLMALVVEMIRLSEGFETVSEKKKKSGGTQISEALDYVKTEYADNIKIEDLAKVCHMSETHFRRVFESCMNMSPMDYINLTRVQVACDIMKRTSDPMDVVAKKVGFTTTSTFNRNFKKFLNTSPYQWKINPENYERKLLNYNISALKGW